MSSFINPYTPSAGAQPPELAGRDDFLSYEANVIKK